MPISFEFIGLFTRNNHSMTWNIPVPESLLNLWSFDRLVNLSVFTGRVSFIRSPSRPPVLVFWSPDTGRNWPEKIFATKYIIFVLPLALEFTGICTELHRNVTLHQTSVPYGSDVFAERERSIYTLQYELYSWYGQGHGCRNVLGMHGQGPWCRVLGMDQGQRR